MGYNREKEVAIAAVSRAAALCRLVRAELVQVESLEKGDRSPVTVADFGSQALVCQALTGVFPQDAIVAEEDSTDLQKPENESTLEQVTQYVQRFHPGATPKAVCGWIDAGNGRVGERYWTLDPIDGTKGFLRNDQYAIALALVEQGQVQVAALACPALPLELANPASVTGVLFVAVRGEGAQLAPLDSAAFQPSRVSEQALRFVESVESAHGHHDLQQTVAQAVGITRPPLRMDSQAKYGAVARGDAALYLRLPSPQSPDYREKIWDHAAGSLIVEEAGGRVTDMFGRPLDFAAGYKMQHNRGVVVSNGAIHMAVLEALTQTCD
ncbi:MAG: 3'(2'),5'-bisphosphate nucleotidase [Chloroflexota bacterium]